MILQMSNLFWRAVGGLPPWWRTFLGDSLLNKRLQITQIISHELKGRHDSSSSVLRDEVRTRGHTVMPSDSFSISQVMLWMNGLKRTFEAKCMTVSLFDALPPKGLSKLPWF